MKKREKKRITLIRYILSDKDMPWKLLYDDGQMEEKSKYKEIDLSPVDHIISYTEPRIGVRFVKGEVILDGEAIYTVYAAYKEAVINSILRFMKERDREVLV